MSCTNDSLVADGDPGIIGASIELCNLPAIIAHGGVRDGASAEHLSQSARSEERKNAIIHDVLDLVVRDPDRVLLEGFNHSEGNIE